MRSIFIHESGFSLHADVDDEVNEVIDDRDFPSLFKVPEDWLPHEDWIMELKEMADPYYD